MRLRLFGLVPMLVIPLALPLAHAVAATSPAVPASARLDAHSLCKTEDRVAALDITATPSSIHAGEPALLTFRLDVLCAAPVSWKIEAAGRVVASGTNEPPSAPSRTLTVAATWTPSVAGEITLRAVVDPDNAFGEAEAARKNNIATRAVVVVPAAQPIREPEPPPSPSPAPSPSAPPDDRGEPGTKSTCTAWERRVSGRGEGLLAVRRARGGPAGFDYAECARRLAQDVAKTHCAPDERRQLAKKTWYLQPGELALVAQSVDCR